MHALDPDTAKNEIYVFKKGDQIYFCYETGKGGNCAPEQKLMPMDELIEFVLKDNESNHDSYVNKDEYIKNLRASFFPVK
jgi:hypothetical protein